MALLHGKYPTDPGKFKETSIFGSLKETLVRHGPCQPEQYNFPKSKYSRHFCSEWYYTDSRQKRDWLSYSVELEAMFCFCCWLFPNFNDKSFEKNWSDPRFGVSNYKKGLEKIKSHENSLLHCISLAQWKSFTKRLNINATIDVSLLAEKQKQLDFYMAVLDRIFSVTIYLASQGLAFRGHRFEGQDEFMETSKNSGNSLELLRLLVLFDPVIAKHLDTSKRKGKYTSPGIQNQIIDSIAHSVCSKLIDAVREAKSFSVILDTTPDVSHLDQLAFSVRYVKDTHPNEKFICFSDMAQGTAKCILKKLINLLDRYSLEKNNIRGQGMDGCSTMSGEKGGLQALVRQICPKAVYVLCSAHRFNLVLCKAALCRCQKFLWNFRKTLQLFCVEYKTYCRSSPSTERSFFQMQYASSIIRYKMGITK